MGLLKVGTPKSFAESKTDLTYVRLAGVRQFISTYNRVKTLTNDELLWGEEVEYGIFSIDKQSKKIKLSLRAKEVMDKLNENERSHSHRSEGCNWVPEYGAWMIEATPGRPYTGFTNDLLRVEPNMRLRRSRLLTVLHDDEIAPTVTAYPLLGVHGIDDLPTNGPVANSDYISDAIINPHPRFGTLTANIRARRGSNVNIRVPLFRDTNTPEYTHHEPIVEDRCDVWPYSRQEADPDGKEMVAMGISITALGSDFGSVGSDPVTLSKYLVNVKGAVGIFYRSAPGTIVANADWPRNGDIVTGFQEADPDGKEMVAMGCPYTALGNIMNRSVSDPVTLKSYLVNVKGAVGIFYRSAPGTIVANADWPRNGDIVTGFEFNSSDLKERWVRLQNGYYLPMESQDGEIFFLHPVNQRERLDSHKPTHVSSASSENSEQGTIRRNISGGYLPKLVVHPSNDDTVSDRSPEDLIHCASVCAQPLRPAIHWVRLQNGYYLPMESRDGKIKFLHLVNQSDPSTQDQTFSTRKSVMETDESGIRQNISGGSIPALRISRSSSGEDLIHCASVCAQPLRPAIHMDAMAFGMGCCCLQVTFQNRDVEESRFIYDQIAVMAPIMMALTASTSILKGRLADTDCRWGVISECVDCRTPAERGCASSDEPDPLMAGKGVRRLYKSRYDSISTYIYQGVENNGSTETDRVINKYNDIPVEIDEEAYEILRDAGIDPALSQHVAHLFVRDPLVVFEGSVKEVDDNTMTEHFESIQSTNWQTVRWKPPPPRLEPNDPHIGWRTEFRSMEMQLTDFENAAYTVFIVLLSRAIIAFDLNLYLPLSRVDANMQRAHSRDAVNKMKFFFRRHLAPLVEGDDGYGVAYKSIFTQKDSADASYVGGADEKNSYEEMTIAEIFMGKLDYFPGLIPLIQAYLDFWSCDKSIFTQKDSDSNSHFGGADEENSYEEMTIAEIFMGKLDYFPGLIPLIQAYLEYVHCDSSTKKKLMEYLTIIEKRAKGELLTPAMWMRKFVQSHPAYKFDSVVSEEIAFDLMVACKEIGEGTRHEPDLLGDFRIDQVLSAGSYDTKLDSKRVQNDHLIKILHRYTRRDSVKGPT
eukprot:CAMPEP_0194298420 /NCGR_PEP_ID=MMETSP0169-20130528/60152_1 /TAXON_ID=218684 /ORGANISM="Corethron pennatum, Strain L29A3" /LENGTH=1095 /DNA_ID=CAMNT_0039048397 /DNA_START=160 /DNA_END=3448 /DNA_ORIENTATION=+